ncbi:MAG TPA: hypothetical protein VEI80_04845 [Candidatus Acidoferrales bacterium]|nr:hypothetical protein [Candidatus Acidoferrales bacterium]
MESSFLVQPWIATRTITDYCTLCYQAREDGNFIACKRALSAPYNSLLATLRMETNPELGDIMRRLEDAKDTCISTEKRDERCHEKMQTTLHSALQIFDQMIEDYKKRYAAVQNRIAPMAQM